MNEDWKSVALKEIFKSRDKALMDLKFHNDKAIYYNDLCGKLERQLTCAHKNMKAGTRAGAFGGYDIDVCEDCGYEWCY